MWFHRSVLCPDENSVFIPFCNEKRKFSLRWNGGKMRLIYLDGRLYSEFAPFNMGFCHRNNSWRMYFIWRKGWIMLHGMIMECTVIKEKHKSMKMEFSYFICMKKYRENCIEISLLKEREKQTCSYLKQCGCYCWLFSTTYWIFKIEMFKENTKFLADRGRILVNWIFNNYFK